MSLNKLKLLPKSLFNLGVLRQSLRFESSTPPSKEITAKSLLKATISIDDQRLSPFNLSLNPQQRILDLRKLKDFIPGDIFHPKTLEKLSIKEQINKKLDDAVDIDKNKLRRKVLTRKVVTPYYQDFHDIRHSDGKLFDAIEKPIPFEQALYMPNISLQPLVSNNPLLKDGNVELMEVLRDKVSMVAFYLSQFGENQARTFVNPFLDLISTAPKGRNVQLVEINVSEQMIKSLISRLFVGRIRSQLPDSQQQNYYLKYGSIEPIKEKLAMVNGMMGYVFLVDSDLKIRWYANGNATQKELSTMVDITTKLN